jgi:hypothetical protein
MARPEPRRSFVETLTGMVVEGRRRRTRALRPVLALGLSMVLILAVAAFGGVGAAAAPGNAVKNLLTNIVGHQDVNIIHHSPASDEYGQKCNSGRGNLSETETGNHQTNSDTLINPHEGGTGPGMSPSGDCDPGNSGAVNSGGD